MPKCKNDPKKFYKGTEPSPKGLGYCAHASRVNSRKKGKDGNWWVVKKIATGSKRWVKHTKKDTNKTQKSSPKKLSKKSSHKDNKYIRKIPLKKYRTIIFCEPSTYIGPGRYVSDKIKITSEFYKTLKKKPKSRICEYGNSYIFGPSFNKKEYKFIGSHANDIAQTGFIDVDMWTKEDSDKLEKTIDDRYDWENREILKDIHMNVPSVLWIGKTRGGDVGADLYAHYNKKKQIDGLIVENNCMYPEE